VNDEFKIFGRKQPWPNLRYYPGVRLEELRKTTEDFRIADLRAEF
jgi:hypothetical protein